MNKIIIQKTIALHLIKNEIEELRYSEDFKNMRDTFYEVNSFIDIFHIYKGLELSVRKKYAWNDLYNEV